MNLIHFDFVHAFFFFFSLLFTWVLNKHFYILQNVMAFVRLDWYGAAINHINLERCIILQSERVHFLFFLAFILFISPLWLLNSDKYCIYAGYFCSVYTKTSWLIKTRLLVVFKKSRVIKCSKLIKKSVIFKTVMVTLPLEYHVMERKVGETYLTGLWLGPICYYWCSVLQLHSTHDCHHTQVEQQGFHLEGTHAGTDPQSSAPELKW